MSKDTPEDTGERGLLDELDTKLTVFDLANGVGLSKGPRHRPFEWFFEGFERGIMIEVEDSGSFRLRVIRWPTGSEEAQNGEAVGDGLTVTNVVSALPEAIDSASRL
jgi:hypothetical protein